MSCFVLSTTTVPGVELTTPIFLPLLSKSHLAPLGVVFTVMFYSVPLVMVEQPANADRATTATPNP